MSNTSLLSQRIEKIHERLTQLYQNITSSSSPAPELLPTALLELGIVSEALQLAMNELLEQSEKLNFVQDKVNIERQRYQELFELLPDGYLVTDMAYVIQEANCAAAQLFNIQQQFLIGKSLTALVFSEDCSSFETKMSQINQRSRIDMSIRFQRYHEGFFNAAVTVNAAHNRQNTSSNLCWLLRDATEMKRAELALERTDDDLYKDRLIHSFNRGEIIPLEHNKIWLVSQGVVKLTTMSDRGEEMLIGLARNSMVFGSSLTILQTYEAIALSKVQLVSISHTEVSQSPQIAQILLSLISQRLRQTESFLSIYGQIRVEDRLYHLLELLKQEIGQAVEDGTRLCVRLTHQDFASACCTTRVTITRLLGKLQQEGKIAFDTNNHMLLKL
jgi:PAS domain S-box-containing protein